VEKEIVKKNKMISKLSKLINRIEQGWNFEQQFPKAGLSCYL